MEVYYICGLGVYNVLRVLIFLLFARLYQINTSTHSHYTAVMFIGIHMS